MSSAPQIADLLARLVDMQERATVQARPLGEATVLSPKQAVKELAGLGRDVGVEWLKLNGLVKVIPAAEMNGRSTAHELVIWGDVLAHVRRYPVALVMTAANDEPAAKPVAMSPAIQRAVERLARVRRR